MMLQKLTTKEPDDKQLEVALASIKAVLSLEEKYNLKDAKEKMLTLEEVDIDDLQTDLVNWAQSKNDYLNPKNGDLVINVVNKTILLWTSSLYE